MFHWNFESGQNKVKLGFFKKARKKPVPIENPSKHWQHSCPGVSNALPIPVWNILFYCRSHEKLWKQCQWNFRHIKIHTGTNLDCWQIQSFCCLPMARAPGSKSAPTKSHILAFLSINPRLPGSLLDSTEGRYLSSRGAYIKRWTSVLLLSNYCVRYKLMKGLYYPVISADNAPPIQATTQCSTLLQAPAT